MNESTETSTESGHSAEEKFFGIRTKIVKPSEEKKAEAEKSDLELEIVDDRPKEDRRPKKYSNAPGSEVTDDELEGYSEKVKKRINKLRYDQNEERRQKEEAQRMREEAVRVAQQYANKNREYESLIQRGEGALVGQIKQKAQLEADKAKAEYRKAHEEGNTDDIVNSQEKMIAAQSELKEAEKYERSLPQPLTPEQQQQQAYQQQLAYQQQQQQAYQRQQQQQQQAPDPDPKASAWGKENTWFGDTSKKGMTAYAYALHEEALQDNGLAPNSDQYFEYIDKGMRDRFNDYDWSGTGGVGQPATSTTRKASSVVAPSARNNGAKPRKVKLTSTQVSLAKRLGLTNDQYAKQLVKEMS